MNFHLDWVGAFVFGIITRNIIDDLRGRFFMWKMTRDYKAGQIRMIGCKHERTIMVDVGVVIPKCIDCWALHFPDGPEGPYWGVNATPPSESVVVTFGSRTKQP